MCSEFLPHLCLLKVIFVSPDVFVRIPHVRSVFIPNRRTCLELSHGARLRVSSFFVAASSFRPYRYVYCRCFLAFPRARPALCMKSSPSLPRKWVWGNISNPSRELPSVDENLPGRWSLPLWKQDRYDTRNRLRDCRRVNDNERGYSWEREEAGFVWVATAEEMVDFLVVSFLFSRPGTGYCLQEEAECANQAKNITHDVKCRPFRGKCNASSWEN